MQCLRCVVYKGIRVVGNLNSEFDCGSITLVAEKGLTLAQRRQNGRATSCKHNKAVREWGYGGMVQTL